MTDRCEVHIGPREGLNFDWNGLWNYRDLLFILVRRDFVSKYKQTILGPIWFVVQPLSTTLVFTVIFGKVGRISTDGVPPILFYLCGILAWGYFANNFTSISTTFVSNAGLFGKVYFPRLVIPLSTLLSNLFASCIQFLTFAAFWTYIKIFTEAGSHFQLRWGALALPLMVAQIGGLSLGVGLWMSALTAKYRDLVHLSSFLLQIWMYVTPVVFPLSIFPNRWRWAIVANPMTVPVEAIKYMFLGICSIKVSDVLVSVVLTLAILVTGLIMFGRVERTFVDTV